MMILKSEPRSPAPGWCRFAAGLLLGLAGLLAVGAARAEDDPPGRVGRVAELRGQAWMLEDGQREWFDLQRNRPVTTGDRIATDADARVELQIGSTTVRLDGRSELEIQRLDDDRIDLALISGTAAVRIREPEVMREFSLQSGELSFIPRSTGLFRIDSTQRGSQAAVLSGALQASGHGIQVDLRSGQRAELWLDPADGRLQSAWSALPDDDFQRYVLFEDGREQARSNAYAQRGTLSPEMTGSGELDQYGGWQQHPEYGPIWAPTTVAVDWAPYRYGHWVSIRPWGWTWVDDAPWGFAPFHYGRWVHWGGRWCWAPGSYVRRPVYAPAMVAWVGGGNFGVSVGIGAAPMVGWIPLAPREVYVPSYRVTNVYVQNINITHVRVPREGLPRPLPGREIEYANRGVRGGVTVVSSKVLSERQPVGRAERPADEVVMRAMKDKRATVIEAPPVAPRPLPAPAAGGRRYPSAEADGPGAGRPNPGNPGRAIGGTGDNNRGPALPPPPVAGPSRIEPPRPPVQTREAREPRENRDQRDQRDPGDAREQREQRPARELNDNAPRSQSVPPVQRATTAQPVESPQTQHLPQRPPQQAVQQAPQQAAQQPAPQLPPPQAAPQQRPPQLPQREERQPRAEMPVRAAPPVDPGREAGRDNPRDKQRENPREKDRRNDPKRVD